MSTGRNDFSRPVIDALAKRAGYLCSNPDCRQLTVGSNALEGKATIIGEAAHITAAALGGPRYDNSFTSEQRSDIINGIWLCSSCATLVDKDPVNFPTSLLHEWKGGVEAETRLKLRGSFKGNEPQIIESITKRPILEIDFAGGGRGRANGGYSMKNPQEIHDGRLVIVVGNEPIIYWSLFWRYQLVIYNNSSYPAYNVRIENVNNVRFAEFGQLDNINNIPPLEKKELKIRYEDWLEGVWHEADALLKPRYPASFNVHLVLRLIYQSEERKEYRTVVQFKDGELINRVE
jgi:hypothetical protein